MTETNAITVPENAVQTFTQDDFLAVSKSGDYLPRLGVVGSQTELFKEGKIKEMGKLFLQWDKARFKVLGEKLDIVSYLWRPKALDMRSSPPLSYFDRNKDTFKNIQVLSGQANSSCLAGPEFLIWIPEEGQMANLFCGSKTSRRAAPNILTAMTKGRDANNNPIIGAAMVTLKVVFIKQGKNSWHGFEVLPCNTALSVQPDEEQLQEEIEKFLHPVDAQVERAPEAAGTRER